MAWNATVTVVTFQVIASALWNGQVRDNMNETAPAKVTTAGDIIVGTGPNAIKRLAMGAARAVLQVNAAGTDLEWTSALLIDTLGIGGARGAAYVLDVKGTTTDSSAFAARFRDSGDNPIAEFRNDKVAILYGNVGFGVTPDAKVHLVAGAQLLLGAKHAGGIRNPVELHMAAGEYVAIARTAGAADTDIVLIGNNGENGYIELRNSSNTATAKVGATYALIGASAAMSGAVGTEIVARGNDAGLLLDSINVAGKKWLTYSGYDGTGAFWAVRQQTAGQTYVTVRDGGAAAFSSTITAAGDIYANTSARLATDARAAGYALVL